MDYEFVKGERLLEPEFLELLEPEYRAWVVDNFDPEMPQVLAAWVAPSLLAGLSVIDHHKDSPSAELQSLMVASSFQREGVEEELLARQENRARERGASYLKYSWKEPSSIETLLHSRGWAPLELLSTDYYFYIPEFYPPWFTSPPPLPEGYSLMLFAEASDLEKEQLENWSRQEHLQINPETASRPKELINYLLLKKGSEIIGWIETHRVAPDTISYSSLFIFKNFRSQGLAVKLLAESIRLHQKTEVPIAVFTLNPHLAPLTWQNYVKKRLAPFAFKSLNSYYSFKSLNML